MVRTLLELANKIRCSRALEASYDINCREFIESFKLAMKYKLIPTEIYRRISTFDNLIILAPPTSLMFILYLASPYVPFLSYTNGTDIIVYANPRRDDWVNLSSFLIMHDLAYWVYYRLFRTSLGIIGEILSSLFACRLIRIDVPYNEIIAFLERNRIKVEIPTLTPFVAIVLKALEELPAYVIDRILSLFFSMRANEALNLLIQNSGMKLRRAIASVLSSYNVRFEPLKNYVPKPSKPLNYDFFFDDDYIFGMEYSIHFYEGLIFRWKIKDLTKFAQLDDEILFVNMLISGAIPENQLFIIKDNLSKLKRILRKK